MERLLLCVFVFLCFGMANAQKSTVTGVVSDSLSGEALPGVFISKSANEGTATGADGSYSISASEGEWLLQFKLTGYKTQIIPIQLRAGESKLLNVKLAEKVNEMDVVVVSAGKFEQNLGEVTVSMEVIKPKLLQDKNVVAIDEVLQQTPGVSIVDDEPQIRSGSGYSFGAGSRVQVLMDDLPMLSGDAGKTSWNFLPIENLSQVEIIKGASSVLYGSAALSGVMNMRTAFPSSKPKTVVTLFQGAFSRPAIDSTRYWNSTPLRSGLFFFHSQQFGQLDFVIGGNVFAEDGAQGPIKDSVGHFTDNNDLLSVDRYAAQKRARMNMNLRYRFKKVVGLSIGLNTNWMKSESMSTLIWENSGRGLYGAYAGSSTRTKQLLSTVDPYITYINSKGSKHSLRTRWQSLDNNNDNNQGNFSDVLYAEYQYQQTGERWHWKNFTSTMGLVGIHTSSRGQLYVGGNADGKNTAENAAAYWQLDKKLFNKLNLSAGVRYEYFSINSSSQSKPVFRAGANYQVGRATYLRASYGQGYRFPTIAEKFIITSLGAIKVFANPDLKPETSSNVEFGVKQGFKIGDFKGFADFSVFQQDYKNFIEFTFGQWDPNPSLSNFLGVGFKSVNTGTARIRGAEISIMGEGKIGAVKIQTLMGYTYTLPVSLTPDLIYARAKAQAGNPFVNPNLSQVSYASTSSDPTNNILKYRLQHLVRADVGATWRKISAGVSFRYNSHMQNIDAAFQQLETQFPAIFNPGINRWRADHTKGDYVFDTRLAYQFSDKHKLAFMVNNLLNRTYAIRPLAIEDMRVVMLQYVLTIE